ncbi:MAG: cytochrome b/b6 domain-containing protein [Anaerolineales bacterium]|nr:cytochrome b/b6 domain-containing protein [Anaerolineales bacterium]
MSLRSTTTTYGRVAQALHWITFLLLLPLAPMGLVMVGMADGPTKTGLYQAHVFLGLVVAALTVFRAIWRLTEPTPAVPAGITGPHVWLYKGVHLLFYVVLIGLGLSGMGILALSGLNPFNVAPESINHDVPPIAGHFVLSRLYMLLLVLHLVGVFRYQFFEGNVFARMGLGWLKIGRQNI